MPMIGHVQAVVNLIKAFADAASPDKLPSMVEQQFCNLKITLVKVPTDFDDAAKTLVAIKDSPFTVDQQRELVDIVAAGTVS